MRTWLTVAVVLALHGITGIASAAPSDKPSSFSLSFGAEYASGEYGTDTRTNSLYLPVVVTWYPNDRLDISLEIPLIYQSNANVTTDLYRNGGQGGGIAKTAAKGAAGGNGNGSQQQGTGGSDSSSSSGGSSSSVTGLGDIVAHVGMIALHEGRVVPQVRPYVFVKFPTANESDGLGTGEFDAGAGLEVTKWLGDLHLVGEGAYTWQGKANDYDLNNYLSYAGGVGYQISSSLEPMILVKGATAPSDDSGTLLEVRARVIWALTTATTLDLFGSRGIADGSPDYGGGIAVIYAF